MAKEFQGERHGELVRQLNELLPELYTVYHQRENKHMGVFLHQSINMHADDETLARIVADVQEELTRMQRNPLVEG